MSKRLLVFLLTAFAVNSFAQPSLGIKAGLNLNQLAVTGRPDDIEFSPQPNIGFHAGVFAAIHLAGKIYFLPEMQFSKRGYDLPGARYKLNYLEIPVLFSFMPARWLNLDIGPSASYKLSAVVRVENDRGNVDFMFTDFDLGLNAGIHFNISGKIGILSRYYYGLVSISELDLRDANNASLGTMREFNRGLQLGLSYKVK